MTYEAKTDAPLGDRRYAANRPAEETEAVRQLKHWTAYRSGATLSVAGIDALTLSTVIITGISSLGPDVQGRLRVVDDGQIWQLVL